MPLSRAVAALPALLLIASCSKTDPPAPPSPPKAQAARAPEAAAPAAPLEAQVDPALRERLARQEAAARMFDRKPEPPKPEPRPEAKPETKVEPKPAPKAETKTEARIEPQKPAEPPKPAAQRLAEPPKVAAAKAPEPVRAAEPKAEPKPAASAPPVVASAAPSASAAAAPPRVVTRVDPEFPREALKAGVDSGVVRARMTLDGAGSVTRVEILEANPRRVFDRAVVQALTQWRFNDGAAGRMVETEVAFRR